MPDVHPTAVVEAGARLAADVAIGPFSRIGPEVRLDSGVSVASHVAIGGRTTIGAGTRIFPFASLGQPPQHQGYSGEPSELIIGRDNVIREHVTMHPGTAQGSMATRIGDHGYFMVGAHVAHDCRVGDHVILANNATLGGHVAIADFVVVGGLSAIHQYVRIGRHVMVGGMTGVTQDVIPFGLVVGDRGRLVGVNTKGLTRRGMPAAEIAALRTAYRRLFRGDGPLAERVAAVAAEFQAVAPVMEIVDFIRSVSVRRLCQPRSTDAA